MSTVCQTRPVSSAALRRLDALPRISLMAGPTPLHRLPRFSEEIGAEVWIKRDDIGELMLAGNKVRKYELALADPQARSADLLITTGALQSNSARAGAAAAARLGMSSRLLLAGATAGSGSPTAAPPPMEGNLLLDHLLGADVEVVDGNGWRELNRLVADEVAHHSARGRRPVGIPVGCSSPLGSLGFALAYRELARQLQEAGVRPGLIVHASSSAGTHAGLLVGRALLGDDTPIHAIDVGPLDADNPTAYAELANQAGDLIGMSRVISASEVVVDEEHLGEGYGIATPDTLVAISLLARTEAILTDPVYSGKGLAAVITAARQGVNGPIVFWHTGGYHSVFTARAVSRLLPT